MSPSQSPKQRGGEPPGQPCAAGAAPHSLMAHEPSELERATLAALVEHSPDAVVGEDLEGNITSWNPGAQRLFGYEAAEVIGRHVSLLAPPENPAGMLEIIQRVKQGEVVQRVAAERRRKDGQRIVVSLAVCPVRAPDGRILGILKIAHDITQRRRAQQALEESERNLRILFNGVMDGVVLHTLEGRIVDANESWCRLHGVSLEQARGLSIADVSAPSASQAEAQALWAKALGGEPQFFEWASRRGGDGSRFEAEVFLRRIHLNGQELILASVRDITERKQAEQALLRQNQRLSLLNGAAQSLLSTTDAEAALNRIYDRMAEWFEVDGFVEFGLNPAGDSLELVACKTVAGARQPTIRRLALGQWIAGKVAQSRRPMVVANAQASADPELYFVRELRANAYACEPLVVGERLLGTISFASSSRESFDCEELAFFHTLANYIALAKERLRLRRELQEHAEGLEQTVRERTAQLVEANANLQTFAYTAAHDLRSPLRSIQGYASIAADRYGRQLGAEGQDLLHRVAQATEQMGQLLADLLAYSKLSRAELRLEKVELSQAVEEALALLREEIRTKGAEVTVERPLAAVLGHPATVTLVISNLLSNALKFVPAGVPPRIRIGAREVRSAEGGVGNEDGERGNSELREPAALHSPLSTGRVRLWVQDNGIGIAPEDQGKLFEIFQRLQGKSAYPGTGLGLAIVRRAVERMGGRVGVESEPGQGSRFWIELPLAADSG